MQGSLYSGRRKSTTKKVQPSGRSAFKKFEDLAEHKSGLVELQKAVLLQTLAHQKEKHEMEMELLRIKLAIKKKKLAVLE